MRENDIGILGRGALVLGIALFAGLALANIARGEPQQPFAFLITLAGFALFLAAKLSVLGPGRWITFGSGAMTPAMGNAYRLGYWLMIVGVLVTFH